MGENQEDEGMKIYKYGLFPSAMLPAGALAIAMPEGAEILSVQEQYEAVVLWARVDPSRPKVLRMFWVGGTGHTVPETAGSYVASVVVAGGALVWHIFDHGERPSHE